ncbi:hypothetical protein Q0N25_13790, partial [Staphylococcus aureus]|nr:hypothetical protein [Staphylococcus aureus]
MTHLQSLSLSGDALSPVVISQFAANLVESAHITDFSLASSQMGVLGMRALLSGGFPPHLKCLSLAGNKLNAAAIS